MAEGEHHDDSWIGRRVAQYRRDRQWTLATLAAKVGLSTTQLSRIESGSRQPSIGTLIQIAHAFGVSLSRLVEEQYSATYHVTRAGDRAATTRGLALLSGDFPGIQAVYLTIPHSSEAPDARHGGEEFIFVLTGTVDVYVGIDAVSLAPGDAIHFPSHTTHRVHNAGGGPAEILLVAASSAG